MLTTRKIEKTVFHIRAELKGFFVCFVFRQPSVRMRISYIFSSTTYIESGFVYCIISSLDHCVLLQNVELDKNSIAYALVVQHKH